MIARPRHLITFAALSAAGIVVSMAIPLPVDNVVEIDPRNGRLAMNSRNIFARARRSGDVQLAISTLGIHFTDTSTATEAEVQRARSSTDLLRRELRPLQTPPEDAPARRALELEDATLFMTCAALASLADDDSGAAVESFFAEAVSDPTETDPGPDACAASALADPVTPSPEELLELAAMFAARGRTRAQLRWLLRAFGAHSTDTSVARALIGFYLAHSRLDEALAVVRQHGDAQPTDPAFWAEAAKIARWSGDPKTEAMALEQVLLANDDTSARRRLLDIYVYLQTPELGVAHARVLAEQVAELTVLEEAATDALQRGLPDQALPMLERLAIRASNSTFWRERIVECALQDYRIDRATQELERLVHLEPDGPHAERLAGLYRRAGRPSALADLFEWQLSRSPDDHVLRSKLLHLRAALGEHAHAKEIAADSSGLEPQRFENRVDPEERERLDTLRSLARDLALGTESDGQTPQEVLDLLRPYLHRPDVRTLAENVLARFSDNADARALRIELVDVGRQPTGAMLAAEALCADFPGDLEILRLWVQRCVWADRPDHQRRARQALAEADPTDLDNRVILAQLARLEGDLDLAMRELFAVVDARGLSSREGVDLIDVLFSRGEDSIAIEWLERLLSSPDATPEDKIIAAREFIARQHLNAADTLFTAVLEEQPEHPEALMAAGQIRLWTERPADAIPYFERCLAAGAADAGTAAYSLANALAACGRSDEARAAFDRALVDLEATDAAEESQRVMYAHCLAEVGQVDAAAAAYRSLVEERPRDTDRLLDYADALVRAEAWSEAERIVRRVRDLAPEAPRGARIAARLHLERGAYDEALAEAERACEIDPTNTDLIVSLGHELTQRGADDHALDAMRRWRALEPRSGDAGQAAQRAFERTADFVDLGLRYRDVAGDRATTAGAALSLRTGERDRVDFVLGLSSFRGRAAAVDDGMTALETDAQTLDVAWEHSGDNNSKTRFGIEGTQTDRDDLLGAFAVLHLQDGDPYAALELRGYFNRLLDDPFAAPALRGRQHGVDAVGYRSLSSHGWVSGGARLRSLSVERPDVGGRAEDLHLSAEFSVGTRVWGDGSASVSDRYRVHNAPSGPASVWLGPPSDDGAYGWTVNTWGSLQTYRLLGGATEIDGILPIGAASDYAILAARANRRVANRLGVAFETYVGAELGGEGAIWGVQAAATWRPSEAAEWNLRASRGDALSRSAGGDTAAYDLQLEFVWRW